MSCIWNIYKYS